MEQNFHSSTNTSNRITNFQSNSAVFNAGTAFTGSGVSEINAGAAFSGAISSTNLKFNGGTFTGAAATLINLGGLVFLAHA